MTTYDGVDETEDRLPSRDGADHPSTTVGPGQARQRDGHRRPPHTERRAIARPLTQEWARAIYEDHPLGTPATEIRYRSAYNAGIALALWDTTGKIRVMVDDHGTDADIPLNHPGMLIRLKTLLLERHIVVRTIPRADCPRCAA